MPRPIKMRKVCCMPKSSRFGPLGHGKVVEEKVVMTIDEYETIRLMDQEGMTQEECAERMGVARTTVQSIYFTARKKIAEVLVFGLELNIEGGEFRLSEEGQKRCSCRVKNDCAGMEENDQQA